VFSANEQPQNRNYSGYCVHGSQEFPTWHRPYLAMLEQTIYKRMADLAEQYPAANKQTYRDAVKKFRLPYWDYYRPRGKAVTFPGVVNNGTTTTATYDFSVPQIFTVEKIMLKTPTKNQLEAKDNPLRLFNFPKTGSIPADQWTIVSASFSHTQTQRYPGTANALTALNNAVNKAREPSTKLILNMMSDSVYDQYDAFAYQHSSPGPSGSLEASRCRQKVYTFLKHSIYLLTRTASSRQIPCTDRGPKRPYELCTCGCFRPDVLASSLPNRSLVCNLAGNPS
jgi:tyrosinase